MRNVDGWYGSAGETTPLHLLRSAVDATPDRPFLDFSGQLWSYADVWSRACAMANGFRKLGVGAGDTVATMLDNNIDGVAAWFAANMVGGIWVGVNTALRGEFLRHVIADTGARIVLCEPDLEERFATLGAGLPSLETLAIRGRPSGAAHTGYRPMPLEELVAGAEISWNEPAATDISLLVYTGGTTGPSKGCIIPHGYVVNLARCFIDQTARGPEELNWSPLPMYHFNLIGNTITATLLVRGTAAIAPRFSVSGFWPEIERTAAKVVNLLGSMGTLIAQMPDTPEMTRCRNQVRVVHGSPFAPDVQQVWRDRFGVEKVGGVTYGLTEAVPLTTLSFGDWEPPGSSGRRNDRDFDVRIFDDADRELGPNEVGEVVARPRRAGVMFKGYWQRPEATVAATRELWFRTGDLGKFDDDGYFYFVDRKKDYLRRRGENISSQELESVYLVHPDIEQVAVHAVPSEVGEDEVKVTAVRTVGSTLSPEELFEWSKERVPYFALPRYIEFRAALPVSAVGRVFKHLLRDEGCTPNTWDRESAGVAWERR